MDYNNQKQRERAEYRWGKPSMKSFILSKKKYKKEVELYENELLDVLSDQCKSYLEGNWSLGCHLRGYYEDEAIPTIVLIYNEEKNKNKNIKNIFDNFDLKEFNLELIPGCVGFC